jgi:hypothetical protein
VLGGSRLVAAGAVLALFGCGGGGSAPVVPTTQPPSSPPAEATPTPTPTPQATPTPDTYPNGQPIVARVTVKIEQVVGVNGETRLVNPPEGTPIHVGEVIRFDLTAKSEDGTPTTGSGTLDPGWSADPPGIIEWNDDLGFNPRAVATTPGEAEVLGSLDGVRSPTIRVVVVQR